MKIINTKGEAFIAGKVNTGGGKFIKGDKITFETKLDDITLLDDDIEVEEVFFEDEEDFDLDELEDAVAPPNVNTGGGKFIPGKVNTKGKNFVGRKVKR